MPGTYVIVGGSSGIGAAVVQSLVQLGERVVVLGRNACNLQGAEFHACDVTDSAIELPMIEGPIAGLAYLPGTINLKPFQSLVEEDYRKDWEVNFFGATRVIGHYLPGLKESGVGAIVLMSTVAVAQGMPFHASIASAKGAVEGLTRSLAAEFAPKVRVNAVAPSLTETPLASGLIDDEKKREQASKRHPMQRIGAAAELSEAVTFLLSERSSWVTGQVLHVDGGLSTLKTF